MRIREVETGLYQIPRCPGLASASARIESTSLLVAHVRSDDGLEGMCWTYSHGAAGTALKAAVDSLFAPLLVGEDPADIDRLRRSLWLGIYPNITMAGVISVALVPVDIALWDLAAKAAGIGDVADNCLNTPNTDQTDNDADGLGDACGNAPNIANSDQADCDADGIGDVAGNCLNTPNPGQENLDGDGLGDACDSDADGNGIPDALAALDARADALQGSVDANTTALAALDD